MAMGAEKGKYALGVAMLVALVIGGGTDRGLLTDAIVQITTLTACAIALTQAPAQSLSSATVWMSAAIFALCLLQLIPLPEALIDAVRPDALAADPSNDSTFSFISSGLGSSLDAALLVTTGLAFLLAVLALRADQVVGLLPFFLAGVFFNILAATIQFSLAQNVAIDNVLSYTIKAGFFANVNHFSTLIYAAIPFVVFFGLTRGYLRSAGLVLVGILLFLLAAGSRAGIALGLIVAVASTIFLSSRSRVGGWGLVAAFIVASVYALGLWTKFGQRELDPTFGRAEFAGTTLDGIAENWVLGVGFGSFRNAYGIYEQPQMIFSEYVNHAHNDYLEIVFEGGIAAAVMVILYFILLAKSVERIRSDDFQKAALISTLFICAHSLVDYPLRTVALLLTFAYLNGIVFHSGFPLRRPGKHVRHAEPPKPDDQEVILPLKTTRGRLCT